MGKKSALSLKQFNLSADKKELLLTLLKNQESITVIDIIDLFKMSPYRNFKINKDGFKEAITQLQEIEKKLSNTIQIKPIIIARRYDAELSIRLDPSNITAKAQIISAFGGNQITAEQLMKKINELNIQIGINDSAIQLLLNKSKSAPPGKAYQITIAKGKEAVNGHDSYFSALVDLPKNELVNSIEKEEGSIDIDAVENMIAVEPGTPLIRKFTYLPGEDGLTVTNKVIPHINGNDIPFQIGENTEISETDPNLLVSSVHGTPIQLDVGMKVQEVLIIDALKNQKEPIHHQGTLIIKGDVPPGTNITATGDITVIGFIESSEVKCGGDLFVSKGIIGESCDQSLQKYRSKIECTGSIYANFIQYSTITTEQDIILQYQLIHSDVFCDGYIKVENKEQTKGAIFGGYISSKKGIQTLTLGASSGVKTTLDLNGLYMELIDKDKYLHASLNEIKDKQQDILAAKIKLNDLKVSEKVTQLRKRLVLTISELKKQIIALQNEIKENENKIQQCLSKTNVNALKAIHSNVSIGIGKKLFTSKKQYGATTLHIKNRNLVAESYQK